jgi:hypothetical protein
LLTNVEFGFNRHVVLHPRYRVVEVKSNPSNVDRVYSTKMIKKKCLWTMAWRNRRVLPEAVLLSPASSNTLTANNGTSIDH